ERVLPARSVIVTIVLEKVDLMCACPCRTFFFSFLRAFLALGFAMIYLPFFRFTPTVFFGPLRVRAFVCVRWPCTGRLRRCRIPWYAPISILRLMSPPRRGGGLPRP